MVVNTRRCPYCDGLVEESASSCGFCGKELGGGSAVVSAPTTYPGYGSRNCVACGRGIPFDAGVCPYCGHDFRIPLGAPSQAPRTWMPTVGGILIIIAAVLAIGMGVLYMSFDPSDFEELGVALPPEFTAEDLSGMLTMCGVILIVFAAIAIIGGFFGIRRKHFGLAITGGVFGLLGIGFFLGAVLALIGLILIAISRKEFS